jgi:alanine racemase
MVKAEGYGLGADRVVRALDTLGPWGYGVATADEGAALRARGVQRPVVVFSPLPPQAVECAAAAKLTASISSLEALERWSEQARIHGPLDFHVEVDTGMGRAGFDWRETAQWAAPLRERSGERLNWTGVFTHFHGADAADATPVTIQWQRFQDAVGQLPVSREDLMVHAANSAAALRWPEYAADAVRPGIFLYGASPVAESVTGVRKPAPVASVRARIALVRDVPPGSTVGYGATYVSRGWERWATIDIGYGDGLPRCLGNQGAALVRGRRVPIIGRISMDMTVVDITAVPDVKIGETVTFIGRDGGAEITVEEVAHQAGTISYEILTGFTARLPRVEL